MTIKFYIMYINNRLHTLQENLQRIRCQTGLRLIKYLQKVPPNIKGLWVYEALLYLSCMTRDSWNCPKIQCMCVIWINRNANKICDNIMTSVYQKDDEQKRLWSFSKKSKIFKTQKRQMTPFAILSKINVIIIFWEYICYA